MVFWIAFLLLCVATTVDKMSRNLVYFLFLLLFVRFQFFFFLHVLYFCCITSCVYRKKKASEVGDEGKGGSTMYFVYIYVVLYVLHVYTVVVVVCRFDWR